MRKTRYIILLLAAVLPAFAVSCGREELPRVCPPVPEGFGNVTLEENCILLRLDPSATDVRTRAGQTERGLDGLNENRVTTVDCFFFRTGETDSPAIFRAIGRTVEDAVSDSTECFVKVYYNDDIARVLFGSVSEGTCDAFVIANASINYNAASTLGELRESVLEYDFSQQEVQPYFTMCSRETAQVTLFTTTAMVNGEEKEISTAAARVPLYRCASKAQLYLKLPETFSDGAEASVYVPRPDTLGGIQVRLNSGAKITYADAEYPLSSSDYIHFSDRSISRVADGDLIEGKEDYNYSHTPFYSYPMTWTDLDDNAANFIFSIPWQMVRDPEGNEVSDGVVMRRYYKISANVTGRKFEPNYFYRTFVYIQGIGAEELDKADDVDECWYIITPWVHEGVAAASGAESISGEFVRYTFLVVEPDEVTLNNEADYTFKFSSSSDLQDYKVVIDKVSFYKYNTGVGVLNERTVNDSRTTAAQRTPGNANYIDGNEYSVTYNYASGEIYFHHDLDEVYEQRDIYLTVTNRDGISQQVKIHQLPSIYVDTRDGDNAFIDGYFRHVYPAPFTNAFAFTNSGAWNGYFRSASYYRGYSYQTPNSRYGWLGINTTNGTSTTYINNGYSSYVVWTPYGNMFSSPTNANLTMDKITALHLSAFNSGNHSYTVDVVDEDANTTVTTTFEYRIGDPRVPNDFTGTPKLEPYLSGMGTYSNVAGTNNNVRQYNVTRTDWGTLADQILISTTDHERNNLIAPYILVNSAYSSQVGSDGYGLSFEQAKKKCATWQEGGYPAGRWRLPTEAEIMYIISRQRDGTIPILFNDSEGACYWSASGYYYEQGRLHWDADFADGACRCVYDAWYWGDDRITNTHIYTPMPE